jgi:hypothetical protein
LSSGRFNFGEDKLLTMKSLTLDRQLLLFSIQQHFLRQHRLRSSESHQILKWIGSRW